MMKAVPIMFWVKNQYNQYKQRKAAGEYNASQATQPPNASS